MCFPSSAAHSINWQHLIAFRFFKKSTFSQVRVIFENEQHLVQVRALKFKCCSSKTDPHKLFSVFRIWSFFFQLLLLPYVWFSASTPSPLRLQCFAHLLNFHFLPWKTSWSLIPSFSLFSQYPCYMFSRRHHHHSGKSPPYPPPHRVGHPRKLPISNFQLGLRNPN